MQGFFDSGAGVERQPGIDFGGNFAGDNAADFLAYRHRQRHAGLFQSACIIGFYRSRDNIVDQRAILGKLRGLEYQRGVGGRVLGSKAANGFDVTGVGNDIGHCF